MSRALAADERATIVDLFTALGPDHPTLCAGWTNHHLVAHLVVREWKPKAALGIVVPKFAHWHDDAVATAVRDRPFPDLVDRVRRGAPLWWKPGEGFTNLTEYFIHIEDVRRGAGDTTPRPVAQVGPIESAIWKILGRSGKLAVRKVEGIGVDLVNDKGDVVPAKPAPTGGATVQIVGRPGEIQLYLYGRKGAANVSLQGPSDGVDVLEAASLGI